MRIVIADDYQENRYLLEVLLKGHGHEVFSTSHGAQALELLKTGEFDLIISDILMPVMDGYQLCMQCKMDETLNHIPFVFYTATYIEKLDEDLALKLGADRFIRKPAEPDEFMNIINGLMKEVSSRKEGRGKVMTLDLQTLQAYNDRVVKKLDKKILQLEKEMARRKKAEDSLRESEEKYRNLVENANEGISVIQDGRIKFTNKALSVISGYPIDELLNKPILEFVHPEDRGITIERETRRLNGEIFEDTFPLRVFDRNGHDRWARVSAVIINWEGKPATMNFLSDITEQREAEIALHESEAKYRGLVETAGAGIVTVDLESKITFVNDRICRMMGYSREELLGKPFPSLLHTEDLAILETFVNVLAGARPQAAIEFRAVNKDGDIIWMHSNPTAIIVDKLTIGYSAIIHDITSRKQVEANLSKSYAKLQKTLGDTVKAMARIVEMKDPYTAGHQVRVTELAIAIALAMKLQGRILDNIFTAATIHDIGKIYVPSDLLSKPGRLNELELKIIQTHAQAGFDILKNIDFGTPIAEIAYQHHERCDGSGYPRALKNSEILLEARILAVADVVEAMSSHRPYRPALAIEIAMDEISKNKGIKYDPEVVDACLQLFSKDKFKFRSTESGG